MFATVYFISTKWCLCSYPAINTCKGNVKKELLTLFYGYIDKKWDFVSFSVSIKTVQVQICTVNT